MDIDKVINEIIGVLNNSYIFNKNNNKYYEVYYLDKPLPLGNVRVFKTKGAAKQAIIKFINNNTSQYSLKYYKGEKEAILSLNPNHDSSGLDIFNKHKDILKTLLDKNIFEIKEML